MSPLYLYKLLTLKTIQIIDVERRKNQWYRIPHKLQTSKNGTYSSDSRLHKRILDPQVWGGV